MNVVITGGSKGIGKAVASKFAASGYDVFLCARNADRLKETAMVIEQNNPSVNTRSQGR